MICVDVEAVYAFRRPVGSGDFELISDGYDVGTKFLAFRRARDEADEGLP